MPYYLYNDKKVYYRGAGKGQFLLLLHGNSVSSKMLGGEFNYYKKFFRVFMLDYPGHGKSQKLDAFAEDFWYDTAKCVIGLCKATGVKKMNIIGTDGGAQVALNIAMEEPQLVNKIIADSFLGIKLKKDKAEQILAGRNSAMKQQAMRFAYFLQHGFKWKDVVKKDGGILGRFAASGREYFHKDLSRIGAPVLFTGSRQDELFPDMEDMITQTLKKNEKFTSHIFDNGAHMTMVSRRYDFRALARDFFNN